MNPQLTTFEDSALITLALAGQTECFTVLMDRHLIPIRKRIASIVANAAELKTWFRMSY